MSRNRKVNESGIMGMISGSNATTTSASGYTSNLKWETGYLKGAAIGEKIQKYASSRP